MARWASSTLNALSGRGAAGASSAAAAAANAAGVAGLAEQARLGPAGPPRLGGHAAERQPDLGDVPSSTRTAAATEASANS